MCVMRTRADVREHWHTTRKVSCLYMQISQDRANDKHIHPLTILQRSVGNPESSLHVQPHVGNNVTLNL